MIKLKDLPDHLNLKVRNYVDLSLIEKEAFWSSEIGHTLMRSYLFNRYSLNYYLEYGKKEWCNNTLIVYNEKTPLVLIPSIDRPEKLGFAGSSTQIFSVCDEYLSMRCKNVLIKWLKSQQNGLIKEASVKADNLLLELCFNQLDHCKNSYIASVNLKEPISHIFKSFSKGHRHSIKKAAQIFQTKIINNKSANEKLFVEFKELHLSASGRKTRSDKSWELQFEMILQDKAYLVTSHDSENRLVSGSYIMLGADEAFYGVAASLKSVVESKTPSNHIALFHAIKFAKAKKVKKFVLGEIYNDYTDQKLQSISRFKKGFASIVDVINSTTFKFGNQK